MAKHVSTHHSHRLEAPDVRALLRLCNALHATSQRQDYKLKLLEGVRELTDADHAWASVASFGFAPAADSDVHIVSEVQVRRGGSARSIAVESQPHAPVAPWASYRAYGKGLGATAATAIDWCTSARSPASRSRRERGRSGARATRPFQFVHSFVPLVEGRVVACLSVARTIERPKFTGRDCSVVCVLHSEVGWVYRADVMLLSPETRALSQRERETLQHLLAGKSEKQIATAMRLSHNTIHHYVKALHRHFKVSSRSELLARWVK